MIIAGDFNEPSHLDWTARAAAAGRCPTRVLFPVSRRLHKAGLVDTFRAAHRDELKEPGITWPANEPGYPHRADRIDFVYVSAGCRVLSCDVVHTPSDHSAVLAVIDLDTKSGGATNGGATNGGATNGGATNGRSGLASVLGGALVLAVVLLLALLVIISCVWKRTTRYSSRRSAQWLPSMSSGKLPQFARVVGC